MKIHAKYKPELVISKDETRYNLNHPYLDATKKMVFATDGASFIGVPVEIEDGEKVLPEGESGRYLSAHALKVTHAEKNLYGLLDVDVTGDRMEPLGLGLATNVPKDCKFPDVEPILPRLTERKMDDPIADDGTVTVSFDARRMFRLANALGNGDQVVITFKVGDLEKKAIQVRSAGGERNPREIALLMPCRWR